MIERKGFAQLLRDLWVGRMPCDVAMQNSPAIMRNDKEAVQDLEGERWDSEEVHRGYSFPMILQECLPASYRFRILWRPLYPSRDTSFGDIEAKLEQFSMNPRRTPGRIFNHHLKDQVPKLLSEWPSSNCFLMPGTPPPIESEARSMPADHSLGRDDHKCFLPI